MFFKFFKNIFQKKKTNELPEEKVQNEDFAEKNEKSQMDIYDLKSGINEIIINSHAINVIAAIPNNKQLRLIVKKEKIYVYNYGGYSVEFDTDEDLSIILMENTRKTFKLKGGRGKDSIWIKHGVVLGEVHGSDGDDTIINSGTAYYIYGGEGNDIIINNGVVNSIYAEEGNDIVENNGIVCKYIDVGSGDDIVKNNAEVGRYITGGDGTDTLINNGNISWTSTNGFENMTGEVNGILYLDGEKFSGIYEKDGLMYQDGRVLTGKSAIDNLFYVYGVVEENNSAE
ncbi:MAG: hypothetical protein K6A44_08130 [bacterium]|nr:hypothetical protein [bacterium]